MVHIVVKQTLLKDPSIVPLAYDPYSAFFLATPHTFAAAWSEWLGPRVHARFQVSERHPNVNASVLRHVQSTTNWNAIDVYGYISQWMSHRDRDAWWTDAQRSVLHTLVEHTVAYKEQIRSVKDTGHNPRPPPTAEAEKCPHCNTVLGCVRCYQNARPEHRCVRHILVKRRAPLCSPPPPPPEVKPTFVMTNTSVKSAIPPKVRPPNSL